MHQARKRFGQNFLVDEGIIEQIVSTIAPRASDVMVEIGPGLGALTGPLLARIPHLNVVEIDRDLVERLKRRFSPSQLTIHEGDALQFDFARLGAPLRVVGNLPYNISTPLLFHLAEFAGSIQDMLFMLQKEVVDRMVAEPDSPAYGRLSVMLQYRFEVASLFDVPPSAFRPAPKVTSSIVWLKPRPASALNATDEAVLSRVVSAAFGQRRKTLRNCLAGLVPDGGFVETGIDPGARGEKLAVADYVRLANWCAAQGAPRA